MQEFKVAAAKAANPKDLELLDIPFGERVLYVKRPTPGQLAMFPNKARRSTVFIAAMDLLEQMLVTDVKLINEALKGEVDDDGNPRPEATAENVGTIYYLERLIEDGVVNDGIIFGGDDDNKQGLVEAIIAEWAGRPTVPSSASSSSRSGSGRPSTGRARGKGSTSGDSTSTDS